MAVVTVTVKLADLTFDPALQARADGLTPEHVEDIRDALRAGTPLPPLKAVQLPDGRKVVYDGHHTGAAYQAEGWTVANVTLTTGDWADALVLAAGANQEHNALKRTHKDKRRAVRLVLQAHPDWSARRVATAAAVSADLALTVRDELALVGQVSETTTEPTTRTGRDGKEYRATHPPKSGKPEGSVVVSDNSTAAAADEPPDEPTAFWSSPGECADEARKMLRKLEDVRLYVSGLLESPYRPLAERAAGEHALGWAWDGEHREDAKHAHVTLVSRTYSCDELTRLYHFVADLQTWLLREGRPEVDPTEPTPWENDRR